MDVVGYALAQDVGNKIGATLFGGAIVDPTSEGGNFTQFATDSATGACQFADGGPVYVNTSSTTFVTFDPASSTVTTKANKPSASDQSLAMLNASAVYAIGDSAVHKYDVTGNTWVTHFTHSYSSLNNPANAEAFGDGLIYAVRGANESTNTLAFDMTAKTITVKAQINNSAGYGSAFRSNRADVGIRFGAYGVDGWPGSAYVYEYRRDLNTWTKRTISLPVPNGGYAAAYKTITTTAIAAGVLVAGGFTLNSDNLNTNAGFRDVFVIPWVGDGIQRVGTSPGMQYRRRWGILARLSDGRTLRIGGDYTLSESQSTSTTYSAAVSNVAITNPKTGKAIIAALLAYLAAK